MGFVLSSQQVGRSYVDKNFCPPCGGEQTLGHRGACEGAHSSWSAIAPMKRGSLFGDVATHWTGKKGTPTEVLVFLGCDKFPSAVALDPKRPGLIANLAPIRGVPGHPSETHSKFGETRIVWRQCGF